MKAHADSRTGVSAAFFAAFFFLASEADAEQPTFSAFDVQTVFYISKSDDRNRVDYGIHLDDRCIPVGNSAVFLYWREFENSPPVRVHGLGLFEYIPYGISEQRTIRKTSNGSTHFVKLRQLDKLPISIATKKEADGHCSAEARAIINGKEAILAYAYVKLGRGGLTPRVEYVDVHGKDLETGQDIYDRIRK